MKIRLLLKIGNKIYEGEYLNEMRNGKGKEYRNEELSFDGEYLNGKRHGKGKQYMNNVLRFEGEFINGKRHGKGKEYNLDNKLIFEGEYNEGKRWIGKLFEYSNNVIIEYEILNGEITNKK